MKKTYNIEICRCFNNRPESDRWSVIEWFIPSLREARDLLAWWSGGDYSFGKGIELGKWEECRNACVGEIVPYIEQTFDMCDISVFRIVEAVEE